MTDPASPPKPGRFRRLALYGVARTTVEGLLGARGVILAAILGPEVFGVWALFRLALRYGSFAALGIQRGIEVEVSSDEERRPWGQAAVGYVVSVFGVLGMLCFAISFAVSSPGSEVLRALAVAMIIERLWINGAAYLRAAGSLRRFGIVELAQAGLSLILVCALALAWDLSGAMLGYVIAMGTGVWLLGRDIPMRPTWDRDRLKRLFGVGLPLSLATATTVLLTTVDRVIVVGLEGTEALGYYAFAVAVAGLGNSAVVVVRTVVFPDVYSAARREGGETAAFAHLRDTLIPFARLFPPLLGVGALVLGPAMALVVPQYIEVLPVARLFIFTGMATGFTSLGTLGVVATDRQKLLPVLSLVGLALNAGIAFVALEVGWGLLGVALGALLSRSLTGMAVVAVSTSDAPGGTGRITFDLLWPLSWCAGSVFLIGWLRPGTGLLTTLGSLAIYGAILLPMLPLLVREAHRQRSF